MSRDQKPGKMRVVGSASAVPARRRNDGVPADQLGTPANAIAASASTTAATSKKPSLILVVLFLAGSAVGGAAIPFLGII